MSMAVMTKVWERFPGIGTELNCMLAMADWCNDAGGSLYPSIQLLAARMRVSRTQAQRTLRKLEPQGSTDAEIAEAIRRGEWFIRVVGNKNCGGSSHQYQVNVNRLERLPSLMPNRQKRGRMGATGCMDATGSIHAAGGAAPMQPDS